MHRIFLVDDHPLFREGLAGLINRFPDLKVCGQAETTADALEAMNASKVDAVIVDLSLREGSGIELIKALRARSPAPAVLVISMHDERRYAERCIRAGARGYVMKAESATQVIAALRDVLAGKLHISEQMRSIFVERFVDGAPPLSLSPAEVLSDREFEVFQLLGQGYETRRIADKLGLNIKTIQAFCGRIKEKLQLASASELLREAVRWNEQAADRVVDSR
ncbi:MAG TPA: response regulator transcription factor [Rhizomicrobium sp.]|nr:response regulator transcription factor [Rhizomicrobium sp.]